MYLLNGMRMNFYSGFQQCPLPGISMQSDLCRNSVSHSLSVNMQFCNCLFVNKNISCLIKGIRSDINGSCICENFFISLKSFENLSEKKLFPKKAGKSNNLPKQLLNIFQK